MSYRVPFIPPIFSQSHSLTQCVIQASFNSSHHPSIPPPTLNVSYRPHLIPPTISSSHLPHPMHHTRLLSFLPPFLHPTSLTQYVIQIFHSSHLLSIQPPSPNVSYKALFIPPTFSPSNLPHPLCHTDNIVHPVLFMYVYNFRVPQKYAQV